LYNAYGHNVYKKYQVSMGNPYPVKPKKFFHSPEKMETAPDPKINAEQEAEAILVKARDEAERIVQEANREAGNILESTQEKVMVHMLEVEQSAKEEGYRTGEALARQHYQSLLDEAESMRVKAQEAYENTILALEGEMVETILEIARKVIGMELTQNKDVIMGLIRTAMLGNASIDEVVVRVCPDDYDYADNNKEKFLQENKNIRDLILKKDSSLKKGDCLVETGFGSVDGGIETQLAGVESSFRDLLGYEPEDEQVTSEGNGGIYDNSGKS